MDPNRTISVKSLLKAVSVILASFYLTFIVDVYTLNTTLKRIFVFGYFLLICVIFVYLKERFIKRRNSIGVIAASAAIVVVILAVFQSTFLPVACSNTITLQAGETGEVWLTDVEIDGELVPVSQVQINDNYGWEYNAEYDDYVFYPKEDDTDNRLSFNCVAKEVKLLFAVNAWSGTVKISDGEKKQTVVDLYGENPEENRYSFSFHTPRVYRLVERTVLNCGIFAILIFFLPILLRIFLLFCVKGKDINVLAKKAAPYVLAGIHWLISFYTDNFIFVLDELSARFLVLKAIYLLVLVLIWKLLFFIVGGIHDRNQRVIKSCLVFLIFFSLFTAIMICIWPGNWVWDDIWVFEKAVALEFEPWQHILTSCVYIISLMLLPFPSGIVIVQYTFIAGVIGFILGECYIGLHKKRYIAWLCIPFVLFPVLAMVFYPMRIVPYGFLELLFFFILINNRGRQISNRQIIALVFLNAILGVWRSEGIIFLVLGPILYSILQKDKRLRVKYIVAVVALLGVGVSLQNHFIGNSRNYYGVTAYVETMDDLIKYEHKVDPESAIMQELRETIDVDAILCQETGEDAFWDGAYLALLETQQSTVYKGLHKVTV